jgi:hypothetical protein
MGGHALTILVIGLCLAAGAAGVALVGWLARHSRSTLRAKLVTLFIGLVGAEALCLPALLAAVAGDDITGLSGSGSEHWLVSALYLLLTAYVIGRLFPWREVDAMASDPNATLRGIVAKLKATKDGPGDDE